jgi:RNA polymerase sigma factor (sigma-70 family)
MWSVIEEYIRWLAEVYQARTGSVLKEPDLVDRGIDVIRRHFRGWPGEDDLVSMVAADMTQRLDQTPRESIPPFLVMLNQVADAARHRIARTARRYVTGLQPEAGRQTREPSVQQEIAFREIEQDLLERLSLEEKTVLSLLLDGVSAKTMAKELNVSVRTVYRHLEEIRRKVGTGGLG